MTELQSPAWKDFQDEVLKLLKLQGWDITPEHILGPKKVDAYAEKSTEFGDKARLAIEVKDIASALTKQKIVHIYSDYSPLIDTNKIDALLIVTRNGLTPAALSFCHQSRYVRHVDYEQLLNSLLDFSAYVRGLVAQYSHGKLNDLYVPQNLLTASDSAALPIEETVLAWVDGESSKPLAVLGTYGMGKTTLARRLAYLLAKRHLTDTTRRIPILIALQEISSNQSLDGLLGRHFTSLSVIRNYDFHTFMKLCSLGRYVLILDGFDEMQEAMSRDAMRYNFQQLYGLVTENSRVLILGRDTAFMSQAERLELLHGRLLTRDGTLQVIEGHPDFTELTLAPFTPSQILDYVTNAVRVIDTLKSNVSAVDRVTQFLVSGDAMRTHSSLLELASRPVQLKMLIDVLPHYDGPWDALTRTTLYSQFIELVIRRDSVKQTRTRFGLAERSRFARDLAFWMWQAGTGTAVTAAKMPDSLFHPYLRPHEDLEAVKRDLLAACFLAIKPPEGYYFPHKSFWEFLVAERLAELLREDCEEFCLLGSSKEVSLEIEEFLLEFIGLTDIKCWKTHIGKHRRKIAAGHVQLFRRACIRHGVSLTKAWEDWFNGSIQLRDPRRMVETFEAIEEKRIAKRRRGKKSTPHRLRGVTKKKDFK